MSRARSRPGEIQTGVREATHVDEAGPDERTRELMLTLGSVVPGSDHVERIEQGPFVAPDPVELLDIDVVRYRDDGPKDPAKDREAERARR